MRVVTSNMSALKVQSTSQVKPGIDFAFLRSHAQQMLGAARAQQSHPKNRETLSEITLSPRAREFVFPHAAQAARGRNFPG
jgi:hypothetical protein